MFPQENKFFFFLKKKNSKGVKEEVGSSQWLKSYGNKIGIPELDGITVFEGIFVLGNLHGYFVLGIREEASYLPFVILEKLGRLTLTSSSFLQTSHATVLFNAHNFKMLKDFSDFKYRVSMLVIA